MKISLKWLKEYIDLDLDSNAIAQKLTDAGIEVEEIIERGPRLEKVVVGLVKEVNKHPDADRLSVCKVYDGSEDQQVICGAPNVQAGQHIPYAQLGSSLPNGLKIKKAKIRGVESFGMICSKEELGLEESSQGIWAIDGEFEPGTDFNAVMAPISDTIFDVFITPNRPDCLSHIGIAREIAAFTGKEIKLPPSTLKESAERAEDIVRVSIEDAEGCPRYCARVIRNVKVGPSPEWLVSKLEAVGLRSINNIVDVTNFIMMESGQPMHAFDLDYIEGNHIIVRKAGKQSTFTTLDDKQRKLSPETVMICDAEKEVAIGGIMGGQNSEVNAETKDILLESAYFNPQRIAESARHLQMSTDASQRFERGADPENCRKSIDRAAALMAELAGGTVCTGVVDAYPQKIEQRVIVLRPERVNRVLGTYLNQKEIEALLGKIHVKATKDGFEVPSYRADLIKEIDLIEDVARLVGYDNIPQSEKEDVNLLEPDAHHENKMRRLRETLINAGLQEVFTNSMMSHKFAAAGQDHEKLVHILNPVSDDLSTMRPSLLPGLLQVMDYNIKRRKKDMALFESGRIFQSAKDETELPHQPYRLAIALCGQIEPEAWQGKGRDADFYDLKAFLEILSADLHLDSYEYKAEADHSVFDDSCCAAISYRNRVIGYCGKVKATIAKVFDLSIDVFAAEIDIADFYDQIGREISFTVIGKYPSIEKDFALELEADIAAGEVMTFISKQGGNLLRDVSVFDVYTGEHVGQNKKSLAFRLRFQSDERTLSDEEADKAFKKVIAKAEKQFKAQLREK